MEGDRVAIGLSGKFLPFKYYDAKGNELAYELKEERGAAGISRSESA
jgi:cyanate lyase